MSIIFFHRVAIHRRHFLVSAILPYIYILVLGMGFLLMTLISGVFHTVDGRELVLLGRIWSLPAPMVAAYQYRAFPQAHCDFRLGLVVAAGVTAVENAEREEHQRSGLAEWSVPLGIDGDDIQSMAILSDRQKERLQSLASNMTR